MMAAIRARKTGNLYKFDVHVLEVINIIVSYDMGWSRRSTGRCYDSHNGYGAVIGLLSGKVLDYRTRNRKCNKCDNGHDPKDHDCQKNYSGSAKSMEGDVIADLVNNNVALKNDKMEIRVVIGDKDAVAIDKIRKGSKKKIFKFADRNHLKKNFVKKLYEMKQKHREFNNKSVIKHIKKLFNFPFIRTKKILLG